MKTLLCGIIFAAVKRFKKKSRMYEKTSNCVFGDKLLGMDVGYLLQVAKRFVQQGPHSFGAVR